MASIKHAFQSAIADDPTAAANGEVLPSHWNAEHDVSGLQEELVSGTNIKTVNGSSLLGAGNLVVSGSGGGYAFGPSGLGLSAAIYKTFAGTTTGAGTVDIYTVPAGKRFVVAQSLVYNTSGGTLGHYVSAKIGGTYYRINANTSGATNVSVVSAVLYVFEPGETVALFGAGASLTYAFGGYEFDDTEPLRTYKVTAVSAGDNTVYTATGVTAAVINTSLTAVSGSQGLVLYSNDSGAGRTYTTKLQIGGVTYQTNPATATANAGRGSSNIIPVLGDGDSIIVNSDSAAAGQMLWVNVVEKA
jgi:hypothetical protein